MSENQCISFNSITNKDIKYPELFKNFINIITNIDIDIDKVCFSDINKIDIFNDKKKTNDFFKYMNNKIKLVPGFENKNINYNDNDFLNNILKLSISENKLLNTSEPKLTTTKLTELLIKKITSDQIIKSSKRKSNPKLTTTSVTKSAVAPVAPVVTKVVAPAPTSTTTTTTVKKPVVPTPTSTVAPTTAPVVPVPVPVVSKPLTANSKPFVPGSQTHGGYLDILNFMNGLDNNLNQNINRPSYTPFKLN